MRAAPDSVADLIARSLQARGVSHAIMVLGALLILTVPARLVNK